MKIDYKALFKADEFKAISDPQLMADYVNAKLWVVLQCERRVYGDIHEGEYHGEPLAWRTLFHDTDTHHGIVISFGKIDDKR